MTEIKLPLPRVRVDGSTVAYVRESEAEALERAYAELQERCEKAEKELVAFTSHWSVADCNELLDVLRAPTGRACVTSARELVALYKQACKERDEALEGKRDLDKARATIEGLKDARDEARAEVERLKALYETAGQCKDCGNAPPWCPTCWVADKQGLARLKAESERVKKLLDTVLGNRPAAAFAQDLAELERLKRIEAAAKAWGEFVTCVPGSHIEEATLVGIPAGILSGSGPDGEVNI